MRSAKTAAVFAALILTACATHAPDIARSIGEIRAGAPSDVSATAPISKRELLVAAIDSIALHAVEEGEVVGVSVAVMKEGRPVRVRGYGTADLESFAAATDSTRYHIGSITKPMTAAAILRLAELGRLDLDDDITRYVSELKDDGPRITLRHLLSHTSGLAGPPQVASKFLERRHLEFSRGQLLDLLEGEPRVSAPGEQFAYNNLGYIVLGIVMERISDESYEDHLREGVLAPVAATSVLLCDQARVIPHRARGYQIRDGVPSHHEPVNASLVFAAGGLCSNAEDVARWIRALALGEIVSPEAFGEMIVPVTLTDGTTIPYGFGLFIDAPWGHERIHHGGDVNGFSSHAAHYPEQDVTVVVLTNTRGPAARRLEQEIARRLLEVPEATAGRAEQ